MRRGRWSGRGPSATGSPAGPSTMAGPSTPAARTSTARSERGGSSAPRGRKLPGKCLKV